VTVYVTVNVTWPWKVKVVTSIYVWCPLSRKWLEIATWWQWSAYRKWPPGNQMVMWPMPSRDPEMSRSWPNALRGQYLENGWRYRLCSKGS